MSSEPGPSADLAAGPLTANAIIAKAIELLEERGADALSMRNIGDALGVKAPALYRHIGSKSAMTELILRRVMDRFDYHRDDDAAWDQEIGRLMRAMREHLLAHPWVVDLTRDGQVLGLQRLSGDIFDLLAATGLSTPEVYRHYRLLIWTVWGFVATELANRNRAPDTSPDGRQAGRRRVAPRPPGGEGAPRVPAPYDVVDLDELFDTAVEHFVFGVRGIAARDAD